jgi:hypothetical protein
MADDFNSILEQCLDQISSGKATIWNCLARYPELASELEPLLLAAEQVWSVPKPALSSDARARIDVQVFSAARADQKDRSATRKSPDAGFWRGWSPIWRWAAAGLALLLVLFLSLTIVVDAVAKTLPGSPLHPVKLVAEDTRLWLTPSQDRPKLQLEFARRRLDEVAALTERGDVDPAAVNAMMEESDAALRGLETLPPNAAVPLMDDMVALISDQDRTLTSMLEGSPPASLGDVATALQANAAQAARSRSLVSSLPMPPSVAVSALTSLDSVPEPEGEVDYAVQVTNDGAERVTLVSLVSDSYGNLAGQGTCSLPGEGILLNPGESYGCVFGALVTGNADQVQTDTVTAVAVDGEGFEARVSTSAAVLVGDVIPMIRITAIANPTTVPEPGAVVEFQVRVVNEGLETVVLDGLQDGGGGDLTGRGTCLQPSAQATIGPGRAYECSFVAMVSGNAGAEKTYTVTAIAADDESNSVQASAGASVAISDVVPVIIVSKSVVPRSVPEPAGKVQSTVRVTNLGDEAVSLDALVDDIDGDLHGKGTCSLAPGEVTITPLDTYECSYEVSVSGDSGQTRIAVVTAIVSDDEGNRTGASDSAQVSITDVQPKIEISRSAEPARVPEPGGKVRFVVSVTNRGAERVWLQALVHDTIGNLGGRGSCSVQRGERTVDPGESYQCSWVSRVSGNADDIWSDLVTAIAVDDEGNQVRAEASSAVSVTDVAPTIDVQKTVKPSTVPEPGGAVEFSVRVTNESVENVRLLSLLDDVYGDLNGLGTCSLRAEGVRIGPGDSYTCSFSMVVSGSPGESYVDTVTAVAADDEGNRARMVAGSKVFIKDVLPAITVSKTAKPDRVPEPEGDVGYLVRITNHGPEQVVLNALVDDVHGELNGQGTCPTQPGTVTIDSGETYECSYSAQLSGNAGDVATSTVTAAASDDEGNRVKAVDSAVVTTVDVPPQIEVSLAVEPGTAPEPGGSVQYKVHVANKSFEAVVVESLTAESRGDLHGLGSCSVPEGGILLGPRNADGSGETYECIFGAQVLGNAADVITETIYAVATDDEGGQVRTAASDKVTLEDVLPAISIGQTVEPSSVPEPGGIVTFAVRVANEGTEEVSLDALVDGALGDLAGQGTCSATYAGMAIPPGESYACNFQAEISGNAGDRRASSLAVVVSDDEGNEVRSSTGATVAITDVPPAITVYKTAEPGSLPEPGGSLVYKVEVSNEGRETIALNSLVDDIYGDLNGLGTCSVPPEGVSIQGGGSYACEFQSEVWGSPGATETSTVSVVALDDEGNEATATDSVTVTISDLLPAIAVRVVPEAGSLPEPGGVVRFAVAVTNQGVEALSLDSLMDDVHGNLFGQGTCAVLSEGMTLGPGSNYECSYQADVSGNAGQDRTTHVTAVASDDEGNTATASAGATVTITDLVPVIGVEMLASPNTVTVPGGQVEFSVRVHNLGVEAVTLGRIVDDVYGDLNGQGSCFLEGGDAMLGPGGSYECAFAAEVSGSVGHSEVHTVTVAASDDEGNETIASAEMTVTIIDDPDASTGIICPAGSGAEPGCPHQTLAAMVAAKSHSLVVPARRGLRSLLIFGPVDQPGTPPSGIPA